MNEFPLCRTIKPIIIITGGNRSPSAFRGFCALRRWYRQRKKDVLCINMLCLHFYFANILFFVSFMSVCTMSIKKTFDDREPDTKTDCELLLLSIAAVHAMTNILQWKHPKFRQNTSLMKKSHIVCTQWTMSKRTNNVHRI